MTRDQSKLWRRRPGGLRDRPRPRARWPAAHPYTPPRRDRRRPYRQPRWPPAAVPLRTGRDQVGNRPGPAPRQTGFRRYHDDIGYQGKGREVASHSVIETALQIFGHCADAPTEIEWNQDDGEDHQDRGRHPQFGDGPIQPANYLSVFLRIGGLISRYFQVLVEDG